MRDVRGHNEGSIFPRKDGRWVAAISLGDGRRATRYAKSKAEARDRLRELQRLKEAGAVDGSRMTLGQYLGRWLEDVRPRLAPATWRKHEQHCRNWIVPALGMVRLTDLSVAHVRRYLDGARGLDPQTLRHHRATLRRALADANRDGLVGRNVAALAEPPALPHRERPILTADQARTLIEGTRDDRLHALWVLLVTTGLREAEALGLTWEDVDLGSLDLGSDGRRAPGLPGLHVAVPDERRRPEGRAGTTGRTPASGSVHVRRTLHRIDGEWQLREPKTPKSRRTVILPPVTVEALRKHRQAQLEEWLRAGRPGSADMVFVRPDGRPYHGSKLTTLLYPLLDRLGLPRVTVHALRHGYASMMLAEGVELITVSRILGHSSIRITADIYAKVMPNLQADAAEKMQRAVG